MWSNMRVASLLIECRSLLFVSSCDNLFIFIMETTVAATTSSGSNNLRPPVLKYDSMEGRTLCKNVLAKYLAYLAHDYQLDGICPVIDGYDLLATTPTGSGKTGYLIMLMLVGRELSEHEELCLNDERFPKDPAMIVVCPTKALEEDMVRFNSRVIIGDG